MCKSRRAHTMTNGDSPTLYNKLLSLKTSLGRKVGSVAAERARHQSYLLDYRRRVHHRTSPLWTSVLVMGDDTSGHFNG